MFQEAGPLAIRAIDKELFKGRNGLWRGRNAISGKNADRRSAGRTGNLQPKGHPITGRTFTTHKCSATSFHLWCLLRSLPDPTRREFVADTLISKIEDNRILAHRLSMGLLKFAR